ncbi:MAG: formamidopyrimidine-DNA glycosylase [Candidatus Parcubacteria bacterium]|nr:MAG: formamidopyrimidine-DNA glycosylase [Candidatus Parcubacteria bacterium]
MPELPEVETIKRYLEKEIIGQKIKNVEIFDKRSFKGEKKKIEGSKVLSLERKGKILIFVLSNGYNLMFHLKMTGQILFLNFLRNSEISNSIRVVFVLDRGYLVFNDVRRFGWVKVVDEQNLNKEIKKLGIDALNLTFDDLKNILNKTKRPIKLVLMDQAKIAGIGNIYANESLFLAKIHPQIPANKLTDDKIKKLLNAIKKILKKAIKYEGTSFRFYFKPDESKGKYQEKFLVYQREDEKCRRCYEKIKRVILGGRSAFYCINCQKK